MRMKKLYIILYLDKSGNGDIVTTGKLKGAHYRNAHAIGDCYAQQMVPCDRNGFTDYGHFISFIGQNVEDDLEIANLLLLGCEENKDTKLVFDEFGQLRQTTIFDCVA